MCAGYPKTGNTLLGQSLNLAGGISTPYDIYWIRREKIIPSSNPLFETTSCCIKTHESYRPFKNLDNLYFGKVSKIVAFNRNPFDTLLSAINYLRICFTQQDGNFDSGKPYFRSIRALIPDFEIKDSFLLDFSLEKLRDSGMLDVALRNFGENGTSIISFYDMSGTWSEFTASYESCGINLLKFSYEKLEKISINSTNKVNTVCEELLELSSFLEVDATRLNEGFAKQAHSMHAQKSRSTGAPQFFNKARSGYWKEYLSPKECKHFLDRHYSAVVRNGYESLADEVNSMK